MSNLMIDAQEIAGIMECSQGFAYKLIRQLNRELQEKGFVVRSGRVSRRYFFERTGLDPADDTNE